jgi:hypothetical protein
MNSADRLKLVCRLRSQDAEVKLTCIRLARCGLPTLPKAPQIGPKLHPRPTALPPLIGAVPCGSAFRKVVPHRGQSWALESLEDFGVARLIVTDVGPLADRRVSGVDLRKADLCSAHSPKPRKPKSRYSGSLQANRLGALVQLACSAMGPCLGDVD